MKLYLFLCMDKYSKKQKLIGEAAFQLGKINFYGNKKDFKKSKFYFEESLKFGNEKSILELNKLNQYLKLDEEKLKIIENFYIRCNVKYGNKNEVKKLKIGCFYNYERGCWLLPYKKFKDTIDIVKRNDSILEIGKENNYYNNDTIKPNSGHRIICSRYGLFDTIIYYYYFNQEQNKWCFKCALYGDLNLEENANIYWRSIFGYNIYTVYYGDHPGYDDCFYQDTLKIKKNKYINIMKSRFEHLKEKMKYSYNISNEYRLDIDDIFEDAYTDGWEYIMWYLTIIEYEDDYKHRYDSGVYPHPPEMFESYDDLLDYLKEKLNKEISQFLDYDYNDEKDAKSQKDNLEDVILRIGDFGYTEIEGYSSSILGSLMYISPEVILNETDHTFKSDIWSLGVIFYQMMYNNEKILYIDFIQKISEN
eukprot:gene6480-10485_t